MSAAAAPSPPSKSTISTTALTAAELQHALEHELSAEWYLQEQKLQRDWTVAASTDDAGKQLSPFQTATRFVEQLARLVEEQRLDPPDVQLVRADHLTVLLYTQDGNLVLITRRNVQLAVAIDALPSPPLSTEHQTRQQIRDQQQQAAANEPWFDPIMLNLPEYILTPRLKLRPYRASGDGPLYQGLIESSLAEFKPYLPWKTPELPADKIEAATRIFHSKWVARSGIAFVALDRQTGKMIGGTSFSRITWDKPVVCGDIGYCVDTKHVGNGFASEAANATVRFVYKYFSSCPKPLRIEIRNWEEHTASRKVAERLGFELERIEALGPMVPTPKASCVYVIAGVERLPPLDVEYVDS